MEQQVIYSWPALVFWIGVYQCVLLTPIIWHKDKEKPLPYRLMAVFLMIMGFVLLGNIVRFSPHADPKVIYRIMDFSGLLVMLYSPMFYFYIKSFIQRNFQFERKHMWHVMPALFLWTVRMIADFIDPQRGDMVKEAFLAGIAPPIEVRLMGALIAGIFFTYIVSGLRLLHRFRKYVQATASYEDTSYFRWLQFLALVLLMPVISVVLTALFVGRPINIPYPAYGISLMISIITILVIIQPEVLKGVPENLKVEKEEELEPKRYESSSLSDPQKNLIHQNLLKHMVKEKPYLNQELTISQLAESLQINEVV